MDRLEKYRQTIEQILTNYYQMSIDNSTTANSEVSDRLAFDRVHDQYLWFRFGWDNNNKKVQQTIVYICIKNGKIWVEEDATDLCIVDDLLATDIPKHDIILGFHPPNKRALTEFATV